MVWIGKSWCCAITCANLLFIMAVSIAAACLSANGSDPRRYRILFFFNDTATTEIYTLSLHDALPICTDGLAAMPRDRRQRHGSGRAYPNPDQSFAKFHLGFPASWCWLFCLSSKHCAIAREIGRAHV